MPFPHPSASEWSRAATFRSLLSRHADAPRVGVLLFGAKCVFYSSKKSYIRLSKRVVFPTFAV